MDGPVWRIIAIDRNNHCLKALQIDFFQPHMPTLFLVQSRHPASLGMFIQMIPTGYGRSSLRVTSATRAMFFHPASMPSILKLSRILPDKMSKSCFRRSISITHPAITFLSSRAKKSLIHFHSHPASRVPPNLC